MRSCRVPAEVHAFFLLMFVLIASITYRPWLFHALPVFVLVLMAAQPFVTGWYWKSPEITPAMRTVLRALGVMFALVPGFGCLLLNRQSLNRPDALAFVALPAVMVYMPFCLGRTVSRFLHGHASSSEEP